MKPYFNLVWILFYSAAYLKQCLTGRVQVSVFYEILCPDSINFITQQLHPSYLALGGFGNPYLSLDYVPYGKANTTLQKNEEYTFECQHGPSECEGNRMHSCALAHFPSNMTAEFIFCSMSCSDPPTSLEECSKKLGLDLSPIQSCLLKNGSTLLAANGNKTQSLNPSLNYVPWILYNGTFTTEDLDQSQIDFLRVLCKKLTNSELPSVCDDKKNKTSNSTT